jgi:hypothetical protein
MLLRPKLAGLFAALAGSATLFFAACSSSSPQDMNKGTDVGLGFVPPDVALTAPDTTAMEAGGSADSGDAVEAAGSANAANGIDGGVDAAVSLDVSIDGAD